MEAVMDPLLLLLLCSGVVDVDGGNAVCIDKASGNWALDIDTGGKGKGKGNGICICIGNCVDVETGAPVLVLTGV